MPSETYHVSAPIAVAAGASVSALLIHGGWAERLSAGLVGGAFSFVATPIFAPVMGAGVAWLYRQVGVDPSQIPPDAIPGLTGFALGVGGLDLCLWARARVKGLLAAFKTPKLGGEK